jgi:hypothetical protein
MILRSQYNDQPIHLRHVLALASHPAVPFLGKNAIPVIVSVGGVRSPYDKSKYTQNPDPYIVVWDLNTGLSLQVIPISVANPTLKPFTALTISNDGSKIVSAAGTVLNLFFIFYRMIISFPQRTPKLLFGTSTQGIHWDKRRARAYVIQICIQTLLRDVKNHRVRTLAPRHHWHLLRLSLSHPFS